VACSTFDDPDGGHHDRGHEPDDGEIDAEYEQRKRTVADVSRRVGGLTRSEVRDIMAGD
jgi:hypothetical protein